MNASVAVGLAITVLTLAALWAPVAAERRIGSMVNARQVAAVPDPGPWFDFPAATGGREHHYPHVVFGPCPYCGKYDYHLLWDRQGDTIRRECRWCVAKWRESL